MSKKKLPPAVLAYFQQEGSRGGKITTAKMTAAERTARASKGGRAAKAARDLRKQATAKKAKG